jgi:hypothetical protein
MSSVSLGQREAVAAVEDQRRAVAQMPEQSAEGRDEDRRPGREEPWRSREEGRRSRLRGGLQAMSGDAGRGLEQDAGGPATDLLVDTVTPDAPHAPNIGRRTLAGTP